MSENGRVKFEEEIDKAYRLIWEMYKPKGSECIWDGGKQSILLNILNSIDNELGR